MKRPHWKRELRGMAKDEANIEGLVERLHHLATEVVTISEQGQNARLPIVEQWDLDDAEVFHIQFGLQAMDHLQVTEDPRCKLVEDLFEKIAQPEQ